MTGIYTHGPRLFLHPQAGVNYGKGASGMTENFHFSNENIETLYEKSLADSELTKALLRESVRAGKYEAALIFAENLAKLMPGS